MATIVETHYDEKGIIWPKSVAPFDIHLLVISNQLSVIRKADEIYKELSKQLDVLYDDRSESPGVKFAKADLIGVPTRVVISEKTLQKDSVEVKKRGEEKSCLIKFSELFQKTSALI